MGGGGIVIFIDALVGGGGGKNKVGNHCFTGQDATEYKKTFRGQKPV